jgi:predicted transcriptional regulator of viral defense system
MATFDQSPPRTLGKQESRLFDSLSAAGCTLFSVEDARAVLKDSDAGVPNLLHRLNRKRWTKRLERGIYLMIPRRLGQRRNRPSMST